MSRPGDGQVVYVCRNFYVRYSQGQFLINNRNCYVGHARTLRLAKKQFRRRGVNLYD